jgi:hypothetical protein
MENNINTIDEADEADLDGEFYKGYMNTIATSGFMRWCNKNNSHWAYSDIAVIVMMKFLNKEDFILMRVVSKDSKAIISLYSDYDGENEKFNKEHFLYKQEYEYTDLKEGEHEFYICFNERGTFTFMLKEDY